MVWPEGTSAPRFAPGSLNVIDCHEQFLDLRNWPLEDPVEQATVIVLRCYVLFGDLQNIIASLLWGMESSTVLPCNVRPPPSLVSL